MKKYQRNYFSFDPEAVLNTIGQDALLQSLRKMLLIRNFEIRAEASYLQGKIGGFFHSYIGQEAIQTAAVDVMGQEQWWATSYRCHALALLLGVSPESAMAELFGRKTGNAKGRGGSMHFYTDRMLGGFGIVTGQVPMATGAAFSIKYQGINDQVAVCFLGDGAVAQGAFHESLNLASLWDLPIIYVIENNQWGMGTGVERAVAAKHLAEEIAPTYRMKGYSLDGMDYLSCYSGFSHIYKETLETKRPVLVEAVCERFKGHSISDPGLYRSKEELKKDMQHDPLLQLKDHLEKRQWLTEEQYKEIDKEIKEKIVSAIKYADDQPWPDPATLEEGVFAP
ncbi:MAG: pyruvate dehydrogenase (acetyl-transferring) E1 component subunit alpha [Waddliaceae bacterium]